MLEELTAADVKAKAKELGADLCGIAPMSRFEGAPKQNDPRYIFPDAKSMIVLGFRIPRGSLRGIEEGTHFLNYPSMGYAALNQVYGPMVLWKMTRWMEDHGYEAIPQLNANGGEAINPVTGMFRAGWSRPVREGLPYPDVLVSFRIAAYLAGLGEFGWSKVFLTPEFGPRQRFAVILTDAELEPDPIYEGHICDRCKLCVKNCHGHAIPMDESVKVTLAGHEVEFGKLDAMACEKGIHGGQQGELSPFEGDYPHQYGYGRAIEGACGCIRACMVHLEQRNKLKCDFRRPFRKPGWKQWEVDHSKPYELEPWVEEEYAGRIEAHDEYTNYNLRDNYGTDKTAGLKKDDAEQPVEPPKKSGYNPLID